MQNTPRNKMKERRTAMNLTLEQVANDCGISTSYIFHIERGNRGLSYRNAIKIARVLETTPDELFYEDEIKNLGEE